MLVSSSRSSASSDVPQSRNNQLDAPHTNNLQNRLSPKLLHIALERRASSPEGGGALSADGTKSCPTPAKQPLSHTLSSDPCRPRQLHAPVSAKRLTSLEPQLMDCQCQ